MTRVAAMLAWLSLCLAVCVVFTQSQAIAAVIGVVQLNTAPLIGHTAGPFSIDFQLAGSGGSTATLSDFSFGAGGGPAGVPTLVGGATGDLSSTVTILDDSFLNEFTQAFTPGDILSFHLSLSGTAPAVGFPDEFSFAILDRTGAELPTNSFANVFLSADITPSPSVESFGSDLARAPQGGGRAIDIAPPVVVPSSVPEPVTLLLVAAGLACVFVARLWRRNVV